MRRDLKEAIRRIHSDDYQKLLTTERQVKRARRTEIIRNLTGRGKSGSRVSALRLTKVVVLSTVVAVLACVAAAGVYYYNRFSLLVVDLDKNESLVDNEIKRRANLIPNLLVVSAEYSSHEKALYRHVSEMRAQLAKNKGEWSGETALSMNRLMSSLLAVAEQYPDLKATQSFEQLMADWTETENRIAEARAGYIGTIRDYNALCTTFPSNVYAVLFSRDKYDPFSFDEPDTSLSDIVGFYSDYLTERPTELGGGETPEAVARGGDKALPVAPEATKPARGEVALSLEGAPNERNE